MDFRVIDGCPCPKSIAPYVYLVLREAGQTPASIYRGADAAAILHRHGKHTQAEIHADPRYAAISNPAGRSQHELRSDGAGNAGPIGRHLQEWEIGVDSGSDSAYDKARITAAAQHFGWSIRHPYSRGVEAHHWCFARQPTARGFKMRAKIIHLRATLPHS